MATGHALVHEEKGVLTLRIGEDEVWFDLDRMMKFPMEELMHCESFEERFVLDR